MVCFLIFLLLFHEVNEMDVVEKWEEDEKIKAMFLGLLTSATGWDSSTQIPPVIEKSLEEAHKNLTIGNYNSCVVMC